MTITIEKLTDNPSYVKCPRCWRYTHVGLHNYDGLCDDCCEAMIADYPLHPSIPLIQQRRKEFHMEKEGSEHTPVEVGEYSPETTPENVGNQSGGEWLQNNGTGKES